MDPGGPSRSVFAAILLAGGRGERMGVPKADLEFGGEPLLGRVLRVLRAATPLVVVVRAPGQRLAVDLGDARLAVDAEAGGGPLVGLAAGLQACAPAGSVFVAAVDLPFLALPFIERVRRGLEGADAAVPRIDGRRHPLAACYRTSVLPAVLRVLASERRGMHDLLGEIAVRDLDGDALGGIDAAHRALTNLNTPADLAAARARLEAEAE